MRITEATENYMEAILVLGEQMGTVRSVDVANHLGFSKPTISQYMKQFVQQELESGVLRELKIDFEIPPRSVDMCVLQDVPLTAAAQRFIDFVKESLEK